MNAQLHAGVGWVLNVAAFFCAAAEPAPPPEIVLGMSTVLTGPAANLGNDMREGVLAGFERANRAGGVHGRRLRLIVRDDGYEPARTAPNMRELIGKENVLAIIGNVGTPTAIVAIPITNETKTLLYAAFSGAGVLRKTPPDRYVINYRASYAEEISAMIDALTDVAGLKPEDIAFFTQRDAYGDAGFDGGVAALKRHGLKDEKRVPHVRYERNTLAVENALASLLFAEHEPRAVIMVGAYAPCAKFISLASAADIHPLFLNVSFVGSQSLASELGKLSVSGQRAVPVIVTQVVPHPTQSHLPLVAEYVSDLKALRNDANPGFGSLEGYISARILINALERIADTPTRESLIDAFEGMGSFEMGLDGPLNFSPKDHEASHHVWPTILKDGVFVPFEWKDTAGLPAKERSP